MLLIFGGTTEGKIAAKVCDAAGKPFFYSSKNPLPGFESANGKAISGAMEVPDMIRFFRENHIQLLVDAAHPFAIHLHQNIALAAKQSQIPVIRLERKYPTVENSDNITYFKDFPTLLAFLQTHPQKKLLSLAGVNTIAKLKPYWLKHPTIFRIMNRKESLDEVKRQQLPLSQIIYYKKDNDDATLFKTLSPDAILTKESGNSGGYSEKINTAQQLNIPVFVIQRPKLSPDFIVVEGEHSLRKQIEIHLPAFFDLKTGYTTGSCATAASKAAFVTLLTGEINEYIRFSLPNGESVKMKIEETKVEAHQVSCTVIKDAGDDPDVTHLTEIVSTVSFNATHSGIWFLRGKGVGKVTLPGLGIAIGEPAINKTPRKMIAREIQKIKKHYPDKWKPLRPTGIDVTISVPKGEELAKLTFNPRLGIEGGISIIGTSGIVKPFSSDAFIASIRKEMQVAQAMESVRIVLNSGAKSEQYIKAQYPDLPPQSFIHYGNFIGESIKIADELNVKHLTIGMMIGKAVKLAEGHLDTHSKKVVMNKNFIAEIATKVGCDNDTITAIGGINLARQLWSIVTKNDFFQALADCCLSYCAPLLPNGKIELLLLDNDGKRIFTAKTRSKKEL